MAEEFPDDAWADDAVLRAAQSALERGDFATAGGSPATFPARFPQSTLRNEVRLVEARAASLSGQPKEAVAILEPLVGPGSERPESSGAPEGRRGGCRRQESAVGAGTAGGPGSGRPI